MSPHDKDHPPAPLRQWPRPLDAGGLDDAGGFEMPSRPRTFELFDPSDPMERFGGLWLFALLGVGSTLLAAITLIGLGAPAWEEGIPLLVIFGGGGLLCAVHAYLFSRPFRRYDTSAARHFVLAQRLLCFLLVIAVAAAKLGEALGVSGAVQTWGFGALGVVSAGAGLYYLWAYAMRLREWFGPEEFLARELPKVDL